MPRGRVKTKPSLVGDALMQDSPFHSDIFVPKHFLNNPHIPGVLFCVCTQNVFDFKVNALFLTRDSNKLINLILSAKTIFPPELSLCIGFLNSFNTNDIIGSKILTDLNHFTIKSNKTSQLYVTNFINREIPKSSKHSMTLITYNCHEIFDCESLNQELDAGKPNIERMVDFINYTLIIGKKFEIISCKDIVPSLSSSNSWVRTLFITILLLVLKPLQKLSSTKVNKVFQLTATGRQVARKFSDINNLGQYLQGKEISLKCGNLISALIADIVCGIILTFVLRDYLNPEEVFASILETTETVVNELQALLNWLMGVPAGLKLNRPLNIVLGRFFLYHIYLWKTYIVVLKPFLLIALENSTIVGVFGVSFLLSFASDFVSLATIHIYCFYGYAARLYNLNVTGLVALWRLFCGKKWNPLRNRVDSYTYDVQQLFIGTLMFTVLIFLLPTVIVYYFVFTMLRLAVLFSLLGITMMVKMINTIPIYVLFLRLISHCSIKGDIYFEVLSNLQDTVHLRMTPKASSWFTLWSKTQQSNYQDQNNLTWKELGFNLLRGKIIYPL